MSENSMAGDESLSGIQAAYDKWSQNYDIQENPTRDLDAFVLKQLVPELAEKIVVEVACGTGKNTVWLAPRCQQLIGLDFSMGMLDVAREKVTAENVLLLQADILQPWPVNSEQADVALFNLTLEHVPSLLPVFKHAFQVIRPGGWMLISEYHAQRLLNGGGARIESPGDESVEFVGSFVHTEADYRQAAVKAGFEWVDSREWSPGETSPVDARSPELVAGSGEPPLLVSLRFRKPA